MTGCETDTLCGAACLDVLKEFFSPAPALIEPNEPPVVMNDHPFLTGTGLKLVLTLAVVAVFVPLAFRFLVPPYNRRFKKSGQLRGWAAKNGLRILRVEELASGSSNFRLFRVKVRDDQGKERCGLVQCGGWLGGLRSNQVKVKWEEE